MSKRINLKVRANPNATHVTQEISAGGYWNGGDTRLSFDVGRINEKKMLSIPAVSAAIDAYSGIISSLPLEVHTFDKASGTFILDEENPLWDIVSEFANDELTAPDWVQLSIRRALINGRSLTYIERDGRGQVTNLFPLDNSKTRIRLKDGLKQYVYSGGSTQKTFFAHEIIDIYWKLKGDNYSHINPMVYHEDLFATCLYVEKFANEIYKKGPMPPLVLYKQVDPTSAAPQATAKKAGEAISEALKAARSTDGMTVLPDGYKLEQLQIDPSKLQSLETRQFLVKEACRCIGIPPSFVFDLSEGTFNNTEQQGANFLKFNLSPWLRKVEKECSLKLLGRNSPKKSFLRFNTDELLRGDLKSLISAYALAADKGIMTRDEVRYKLNLPKKGGQADELSVQKQYAPINDNQNDPFKEENDKND